MGGKCRLPRSPVNSVGATNSSWMKSLFGAFLVEHKCRNPAWQDERFTKSLEGNICFKEGAQSPPAQFSSLCHHQGWLCQLAHGMQGRGQQGGGFILPMLHAVSLCWDPQSWGEETLFSTATLSGVTALALRHSGKYSPYSWLHLLPWSIPIAIPGQEPSLETSEWIRPDGVPKSSGPLCAQTWVQRAMGEQDIQGTAGF